MFEHVFVDHSARTRRPFTVAVSFASQVVLIALAVLFPLLHTDGIVFGRLTRIVHAPRPIGEPKPQVKSPAATAGMHSPAAPVFTAPVRWTEPARVPDHILTGDGAPAVGGLTATGDTNGVAGGIDEAITAAPRIPPPPPPQPAPRQREIVKVGGMVQAAKIIHQVTPLYPPLARQARISGIVHLEAVIGRDGTVRSLQAISGHPLLVPAALDAVRQWVYRPTLLNGEPVDVLTQVDVHFKLSE